MAPDEGPNYHADDPYEAPHPIHDLAEWVNQISREHGFWPSEGRNYGEAMALIMSEAAESLEEHRSGNAAHYYAHKGHKKPEGHLVELIDVLIRTLDMAYDSAEKAGMTVDEVLIEKIQFNAGRPHKHGRNY